MNGKWRVAHASVRGAAHASQNTACQDRFVCRLIETRAAGGGEILIAAVADGAGSTSDGQRGAEIACALFLEQAAQFLTSANFSVGSLNAEFGKGFVSFAQSRIAALASEEKKPAREFAATFLAAIVGTDAAAFYQIGDGAIVFSARAGATAGYRFGIEPLEAEYANMTDFITDDAAGERLRFEFVDEAIEDLILFTDGIFAVAVDYKTSQPHEPFLMPMLAPLRREEGGGAARDLNEKLALFLDSPKINEKTDDDKTIILAARKIGNK